MKIAIKLILLKKNQTKLIQKKLAKDFTKVNAEISTKRLI